MPPKLPDGTQISFCAENPKRAGTKAHERYERYKLAKTVAEAIEFGASRSDITADIKNGYCTKLEQSNGEKRPADEVLLAPPAKHQRVQHEASEAATVGEKSASTESPCEVKSETKSEGKSEVKSDTQSVTQSENVDLSFVKLDGKPMKFVKRTMGEARRLLSPEGLAEAQRSGYNFSLKDKDNLSKWFVQLKDLNPDGKLAADLKKHGLDACIDLEIILPDGFPMEPPFARVLYPQLRGGYVFERGGICFEPLTQKGWVPSMTLPALAIAIKGIFDYGEVRVGGVGDKATRTVMHYTEEGARKDASAISAAHRGGEIGRAHV